MLRPGDQQRGEDVRIWQGMQRDFEPRLVRSAGANHQLAVLDEGVVEFVPGKQIAVSRDASQT